MSEVTLQDLQKASSDILYKLDDICQENNLGLTLLFGSVLGAVRHNGFIPWDDDIDVMMTYKDYKRLKKHFKKHKNNIDGYVLQDFETDHEIIQCLPRIRMLDSYMREWILDGLNIYDGIFIDIFLFCYRAKSEKMFALQKKLLGLTYMMHEKYLNRMKVRNGDTEVMKNKIYYITEKMPEKLRMLTIKAIQNTMSLLGSKKSGEYFCLSAGTKLNRTIPLCMIDDTILWQFGSRKMHIPKEYDRYLRHTYGENYMTPIETHTHVKIEDVIIGGVINNKS